jgi:hypothetical protein
MLMIKQVYYHFLNKLWFRISWQLTVVSQTQLPPDYVELEKRVDALKQVHQKMLQVTYGTLISISWVYY